VLFIQINFTLLIMTQVAHIQIGMPIWQIELILYLFAFTAIGFSLLTIAFATTSASVGALQNIIVIPTCLLSGCFFPATGMPDILQKIANFLPQRWVLQTIQQLQSGKTIGNLSINFLILGTFAIIFFIIAIYKMGRNNNVQHFA